ncbi:MarR family transcriptional regulator [Ktedonosporobacter rubrisoli]|uniref:MarR family transcriptional regulator n=1 Tax=Ktedonosporobacter rubrisoli TaxID=2509675 RepID=A0A4P6JIT7_KTERU|nr:MarR family transcriptional regulator [Ktedonosporobacter rubrisoli]QBD74994.1 MarR family transcriptional regulator [Ktedonosporobacter rubrisoli]
MNTSLENAFFQFLAYASAEAKQAFDQYVGMSQMRRQLLLLLSQQGELSHAALQQKLAIDGATVTRLVKQFEAEGVLSRRLDPQDNRYTLVSLTDAGQELVSQLQEAHSAFQTRLLTETTLILENDLEIAVSVLEKLLANIRSIQQSRQPEE